MGVEASEEKGDAGGGGQRRRDLGGARERRLGQALVEVGKMGDGGRQWLMS
jgi:hypothetical protein